MYPQNIRFGGLLFKVRILQAISNNTQRQPRRSSTEFLNRFPVRYQIPCALRHLISTQHQMAVPVHARGYLILRANGRVVVQGEYQMAGDEAPWGMGGYRNHSTRDRRGEGPIAKDVLLAFFGYLVGGDAKESRLAPGQTAFYKSCR